MPHEPAICARQTNPFATRWVRPGAVPYQFPAGIAAAVLVQRLRAQNWWGAIIGPHGSGKSTLLATLAPAIEHAGRGLRQAVLRVGQRTLPPDLAIPTLHSVPGVVILDGYEQLGWWSRRRLKSACRRCGWGLLVTSHAPCGLPELYRVAPDLKTIQHIVDGWLPSHGGLIGPQDVAAAWHAQQGNVRETLFALYDLFEQRRREHDERVKG